MIKAKIIADSVDTIGNRITSFIIDVPQIIVKELLRHRMFSFSSSSMRAIPFNKVIKDIKENMFIPLAFQSHHSGMQGSYYLEGNIIEECKNRWVESGLVACKEAENLYNLGVTKQLCSRIIEPFGYAKILVTATEFDNFFELRCPNYTDSYGDRHYSWKDYCKSYDYDINTPVVDRLQFKSSISQAEIHIQALAEAMWDAKNESTPKKLNAGEWHIPFSDKMNTSGDDADNLWQAIKDNHPRGVYEYFTTPYEVFVATARCARLSYMTFDGDIDYDKDIKLHNQLLESKHFSPFEHCARAMSNYEYKDFIKGQFEVTHSEPEYEDLGEFPESSLGWCNNFRGFIPYRYLLENKEE